MFNRFRLLSHFVAFNVNQYLVSRDGLYGNMFFAIAVQVVKVQNASAKLSLPPGRQL